MSRKKSITEAYSFKIDSLTRKMRRYSGTSLKNQNIDITVDQWGVLGLLYESNKEFNQTELANLLIKDTPTTSRILDILCKKGYVKRKPNKQDRRKFDVILTKEGKNLVESISPIVDEIRQNIFDGLTKEDLDDLDRILRKIERNIEI